ncbi:putative selenium-dependent hydroxylase accessory protein YqeC [Geomonas sp. Red875]|uniref:Putative selenium-dependent hydroxylase accessory protein YqeC n=1 Tax=Geomesophilobacter sediminis TaxID=2798584 RepID=A0A8J7M1T1_9BACT|nr:putative selenium-dependent hydroxylase accessory protein YqeC [Geomesophilobacter sediminis]
MPSIEKLLFSQPQGILALTGAGGKTSLMFHLARLLAESGRRVLTTTTTSILLPRPEQSETVLLERNPERVLREAGRARLSGARHLTAAAEPLEGGRVRGFAPEAISRFRDSGRFDWILVQADEAAQRSLKAPAAKEPSVPTGSDIVVAVLGLDVFGKPLSEETVCHSTSAAEIMGLETGQPVGVSALSRLLIHPDGAFKGAPPQAQRFIFLNRADTAERTAAAAQIAAFLQESPPARALIVGEAGPSLAVHAIHSLEAAPPSA